MTATITDAASTAGEPREPLEALTPEQTAELDQLLADEQPEASEDTANDTPTADANAGVDGQAQPDATTGPEWAEDVAVKDAAAFHQLSADDLKGFSSREAFDEAIRFYDRRIGQMLRSPLEQQPPAGAPDPDAAKPAAKPEEAATPVAATDGNPLDAALKTLLEDSYIEESTKSAIQAIAETAKATQQALMGMQQVAYQQHVEQEMSSFVGLMEKVGGEVVGKIGQGMSDEAAEKVSQAWDQVVALRQYHLNQTGQLLPLDERLVSRAFHALYPEEVSRRNQQQIVKTLKSGAKTRLGSPTPVKTRDTDIDLADDPELKEMFSRFKRDNGDA